MAINLEAMKKREWRRGCRRVTRSCWASSTRRRAVALLDAKAAAFSEETITLKYKALAAMAAAVGLDLASLHRQQHEGGGEGRGEFGEDDGGHRGSGGRGS